VSLQRSRKRRQTTRKRTKGGNMKRMIDFRYVVSRITHFPKYFKSSSGSNCEIIGNTKKKSDDI
jgi:hypothetical protein